MRIVRPRRAAGRALRPAPVRGRARMPGPPQPAPRRRGLRRPGRVIQAAALGLALAEIAATAQRGVPGREPLLDQPAVETGAAGSLRIAVQLYPVLIAIAVHVVDRQVFRYPAAGTRAAIVAENLLPQRRPALPFPPGIVVMPGTEPESRMRPAAARDLAADPRPEGLRLRVTMPVPAVPVELTQPLRLRGRATALDGALPGGREVLPARRSGITAIAPATVVHPAEASSLARLLAAFDRAHAVRRRYRIEPLPFPLADCVVIDLAILTGALTCRLGIRVIALTVLLAHLLAVSLAVPASRLARTVPAPAEESVPALRVAAEFAGRLDLTALRAPLAGMICHTSILRGDGNVLSWNYGILRGVLRDIEHEADHRRVPERRRLCLRPHFNRENVHPARCDIALREFNYVADGVTRQQGPHVRAGRVGVHVQRRPVHRHLPRDLGGERGRQVRRVDRVGRDAPVPGVRDLRGQVRARVQFCPGRRVVVRDGGHEVEMGDALRDVS